MIIITTKQENIIQLINDPRRYAVLEAERLRTLASRYYRKGNACDPTKFNDTEGVHNRESEQSRVIS